MKRTSFSFLVILTIISSVLGQLRIAAASSRGFYGMGMETADLLITLDKEPASIAINEETNLVYVGVEGGLIVINGETDEVITTIPLDVGTVGVIVINPRTNRIFACSDEKIIVFEGTTNLEVGEILESINFPYEIAVNPVTNLIYVTDLAGYFYAFDRLQVYDGETLTLATSVNIPGSNESYYMNTLGVAVNPETNRIYAPWSGDNSLHVIDGSTHEVIKKGDLSNIYPFEYKVIVNPYTNYVYPDSNFEKDVVLDGDTLEEVTSNYAGDLLAVNHLYNFLYTRILHEVLILDGATHEILARLGPFDWDIARARVAVNSKTGKIYLAQSSAKQITVVQGPGPTTSFPEFIVNNLELDPERVNVGEPCTVTVDVMNIGDLTGGYIVTLKIDGLEEMREEIDLAGGQSATVEFELVKDFGGTYAIEVDGLSTTLVVTQFVVSNLNISPVEVGTGDTAIIAVEVTNLGWTIGSYMLVLKINGLEEMSKEVELFGARSKIIEFSVTPEAAGVHTVDVNALTGVIVVKVPAKFVVSNLSISPSETETGGEVTVSVRVANVGELADSININLEVDGTVVDTRTVELVGEDSTLVTFNLSTEKEGTCEVKVNGQRGIITVHAPPPTSVDYKLYIFAGSAIIVMIAVVVVLMRRR